MSDCAGILRSGFAGHESKLADAPTLVHSRAGRSAGVIPFGLILFNLFIR
jgi:hypothetical protein